MIRGRDLDRGPGEDETEEHESDAITVNSKQGRKRWNAIRTRKGTFPDVPEVGLKLKGHNSEEHVTRRVVLKVA